MCVTCLPTDDHIFVLQCCVDDAQKYLMDDVVARFNDVVGRDCKYTKRIYFELSSFFVSASQPRERELVVFSTKDKP